MEGTVELAVVRQGTAHDLEKIAEVLGAHGIASMILAPDKVGGG